MAISRVTVFGSSRAARDEPAYTDAVRLGRMLARAGYIVCSGGYSGLMEAVSRGAAEAGGSVIGITVAQWAHRAQVNAWVGEEIVAPHLFDRLLQLTGSDAYVALHGGPGTLGEVALAWNLFQTESIPIRPLILVGPHWRRLIQCVQGSLRIEPRDLDFLQFAPTVDDVLPLLRNAEEPAPR
jgi:uncharacterized protein (TIGR00730 family)